jgi:hypothetical protein
MPNQFHVPINLKKAYGERYFEAELDLEIENAQGSFVPLDVVLFDSGAGFTSIPLDWARAHNIRFSTKKKVPVTGATGKGTAYLDEVTIAFPDITNLQFEVNCLFNPQLRRPLLSLADVVRNFHVETTPPTPRSPYGSFLFRLKTNHRGTPRP